jgi:hypothetical protein
MARVGVALRFRVKDLDEYFGGVSSALSGNLRETKETWDGKAA